MDSIIKFRVVMIDNSGSHHIDSLASLVPGSHWSFTLDRFDGKHDMAYIEIPADDAEYFEEVLEADENVVSYETC